MFTVDIIQKIAIYVKDPKIVKQLFYIDKYREYIKEYNGIYDELVKHYTYVVYKNDLRRMQSFYRQRTTLRFGYKWLMSQILFHSIEDNNIEIFQWIYDNGVRYSMMIDHLICNDRIKMLQWLYDKNQIDISRISHKAITYMIGKKDVIKWLKEKGYKCDRKNGILYRNSLFDDK